MKFLKWFKSLFTKEFWVGEFPKDRSPECFDCNLGNEDCKTCPYK